MFANPVHNSRQIYYCNFQIKVTWLFCLFLYCKLVDQFFFDKGIDTHGKLHNSGENGVKYCGGYKANKIQCMIQWQRNLSVKYIYEKRSNSKDLYQLVVVTADAMFPQCKSCDNIQSMEIKPSHVIVLQRIISLKLCISHMNNFWTQNLRL